MRGKPYTLDGRTQCLKDWAREFNIPVSSVRERLDRGDDLLAALTAAPRQGDGYLAVGHYGISAVWRDWIMAPPPQSIID